MKNIIHDWDGDNGRRILRNRHNAVPDDGVVLLIEYCVGEANAPSLGKMADVVMLALTGGKERTAHQHEELLGSVGFRLSRTISVSKEIVILEARRAGPQ